MKFLRLLFLFLTVSASAQTNVIYFKVGNVLSGAGAPNLFNLKTVLTDTAENPRSINGVFISPQPQTAYSKSDGKAYFTNVIWGTYNFRLAASPEVGFDIQVNTNTTGMVDGATLTSITNQPNPLSDFYTAAQIDALLNDGRFLFRAGDTANNLTNGSPMLATNWQTAPDNYVLGKSGTNLILIAGGSGGSATNVFFQSGTNTTYRVINGTNQFDVVTNFADLAGTGASRATAATNAMGISSQLSAFALTNQFDASGMANTVSNYFTTNGTIKVMSNGTGNEYTDMRASTNSSPSALGISFTSQTLAYDLWAASGAGYGSNVWGVPFRFPGGILSSGNPFWTDLPNSQRTYLDYSVFWGAGPAASMRTNAWPNGQTNASVQPGFRIVNENPFSGIAWLDTRTAFTNSSHGNFLGTNYDGVSMYLPGFGLQQGMISDAYGNPNPVTGVIDQIGKYSQEAPSYQLALLNDPSLNLYISENAHRTGDPSYGGQAPLMVIETDHFLEGDNEVIFGVPIQRGGVFDVRQAGDNAPTNFLWAFAVDARTSSPTVATTNSLLQTSNVISSGAITANSFVGGGSGLTNLIHSSTVTGVSGVSVALSQNPDGSTNYGLTVTAGGSGTVTSVAQTVPSGYSVSGSPVTTSGTLAITRSGDENNLGLGQTNIGFITVTNTASIGGLATINGLVITNGVTNQSLTATTLLEADANKKVSSIANGVGVLTNNGSGAFGFAPLLDASALATNQYVATDGNTNLVSTRNGNNWTNLVAWTHDGTATNLTATFNGTLQTFTVTNGPTVFFHFAGANGSISYRIYSTNFTTLVFDFQPKWLTGSNNVITNGVLSLTSYGGTNMTTPAQLEAAMRENQ